MPLADMPGIGQEADLNQVKDYLMGFRRWLNDFLNHMDTLNLEELDANVIIANTITADKMSVSQLSAISANMGTITAGIIQGIQIFGSYMATKNGAYPRSEMNATGDFFTAFFDALNFLQISPNISGAPVLSITVGGVGIGTVQANANGIILGSTGKTFLSSSGDIELNTNAKVVAPGWTNIFSIGNNQTLQQALNVRATAGASTSSNAVGDSHNHGLASTDYIQCYDAAGVATVKKQWAPYAGSAVHAHTQT